jgi:hypothetical protein
MPASFTRLAWIGSILAAVLLFAATSSADLTSAGTTPACTHGSSSIGPVVFRDGKLVGGDGTPRTEPCLP